MSDAQLWEWIEDFFRENFGTEQSASLDTILFLIGVQELGSGPQAFSKDDKLNLLHIAVCRLLEPFGYYEFSHYDLDGFPHFSEKKPLPALKPNEQQILMKKAVIQYFIDENLFPEEIVAGMI
ncbi:hypothetical protein SAMN05443429_101429 [Cruoricaptor ignavus]|uniref:Uncharacterized protein n=1 Tax=Cruoricaptor ignavus TaxID=1118202 RepID=A0A1M6AV74_9FLAO|nr:hypothetical protein [Cruoricaptor ignavus]SHI40375.1 hypothetical protein SAMN05443429_101429 [Cruoricaptor ignavus]